MVGTTSPRAHPLSVKVLLLGLPWIQKRRRRVRSKGADPASPAGKTIRILSSVRKVWRRFQLWDRSGDDVSVTDGDGEFDVVILCLTRRV